MKFNAQGYFEAGIHDFDAGAIEEHLVVGFPTSITRVQILAGYKKHRAEIEALGLTCEQLIDGSFVSTKNDPEDIDLVGLIDADAVDALSPAQQMQLQALFSGQTTKATHLCDAYLCPTVPQNDPRYARLRAARKYWLGEFGYDRQDKPKGMVRTIVNPKIAHSAGKVSP